MNILVTNDDGINSVGIKTLVQHLSEIGDVYVCAPDSQRSAFSQHVHFTGKLKFEEREFPNAKKAIALWGTPADCIRASLQCLLKDVHFDLVVSGINQGWNVLADAHYSGTIGAAREAFMDGIPSIAVSLDADEPFDYTYSAKIAKKMALLHLNNKDNNQYYLSINIPALPEDQIKGTIISLKEGKVAYDEHYYIEDNGIEKYICPGDGEQYLETPEGSDTKAVKDGYVVITPLDLHQVNDRFSNYKDIYLK